MKLLYPANLNPHLHPNQNEFDIIRKHFDWGRAMFQTMWHTQERESDSYLLHYLKKQGLPVNKKTLATLREYLGIRAPSVVPRRRASIVRIEPNKTDHNTAGIDVRSSYSPVIINVPHAGLDWPKDGIAMPKREDLAEEITVMADLFVDRIAKAVVHEAADRSFTSNENGSQSQIPQAMRWPTLVINLVSRLAMDPERLDDETEEMSAVGMGVVYERDHLGGELYSTPLTEAQIKRRKQLWYKPYAAVMEDQVEWALERYDRCLIIDLHSYSVEPLACERHPEARRPDICLGYEDFHDPGIDEVERIFNSYGFSTARNEPYSGSYVPLELWRKDPRVKSIMVEIRKDQYLDGLTLLSERVTHLATALYDVMRQWHLLRESGDWENECHDDDRWGETVDSGFCDFAQNDGGGVCRMTGMGCAE